MVMRKLAVGLFLMALTTLMIELLLTRVFDVILRPNMAYMVITCAMFSFGLAGVYATLRPLPADAQVCSSLANLACAFAISTLALLPVLNALPFDYEMVGQAPLVQIASFAGMYLALVIPFFLSGLIFTYIFSVYTRQIQTLYFWDLGGAAIGCVVFVPFLPEIGPGGLLFFAAALGLFASGVFGENPRWRAVTGIAGVVLILIPVVHSPKYYDFREHVAKRGVKETNELVNSNGETIVAVFDTLWKAKSEVIWWDPISKIDVIDLKRLKAPSVNRKFIAYDGGSQSSEFFPFDGDYQLLREHIEDGAIDDAIAEQFGDRRVLASHYFKRDTDQQVLIIGSAGGRETKAALLYGAKQVDAIEMVKAVVTLGETTYAQYIGKVFNNPKVNLQVGEGRSFLRSNKKRYDIIQVFTNYTSSSIASGSGAMAPVYLQTAEAYREYFDHLADNGILQVNNRIYPRMITTAALAWKQMGRKDFRKHVAVFEYPRINDTLPTLLIKMTPWTEEELLGLEEWFRSTAILVENPLHPDRSFLSQEFYSGEFPVKLAERIPYQVGPATDDQPYFNFLRKRWEVLEPDPAGFVNLSVAGYLNNSLKKGLVPMDLIHLVITGVVSLFYSTVFILGPLYFSKAGREKWPMKPSSLIYFSCLGAGFIIIELVFIQIFMKLIGYPLYTYSTVIFTLLLAAAVGSLASAKFRITVRHRWSWPFVGVLTLGGLFLIGHSFIFKHVLGSEVEVRILAAITLIFPMGFFLGMAFPLGILSVSDQPTGVVAWAWGLNGFFTVVGGLGSVLLSIFFGLKMTFGVALAIYFLAFLVFMRMREYVLVGQRSLT